MGKTVTLKGLLECQRFPVPLCYMFHHDILGTLLPPQNNRATPK